MRDPHSVTEVAVLSGQRRERLAVDRNAHLPRIEADRESGREGEAGVGGREVGVSARGRLPSGYLSRLDDGVGAIAGADEVGAAAGGHANPPARRRAPVAQGLGRLHLDSVY